MHNICIIPARGGSKRIPKKNIRKFFGKPIIAYVIETALKSNLFDEVMVSTDDTEIEKIALEYGAKVPFKRSDKNANDMAILAEVVLEVLQEYDRLGMQFDTICCVLPTAVLTTNEHLTSAFEKLKNTDSSAAIPIVQYSTPIQRALKIKGDYIEMDPAFVNVRSQDLDPYFFDAGQFYFMDVDSFLEEKRIFMSKASYIELEEHETQDVDTMEDWKMLEIKYKYQR